MQSWGQPREIRKSEKTGPLVRLMQWRTARHTPASTKPGYLCVFALDKRPRLLHRACRNTSSMLRRCCSSVASVEARKVFGGSGGSSKGYSGNSSNRSLRNATNSLNLNKETMSKRHEQARLSDCGEHAARRTCAALSWRQTQSFDLEWG